jgi:hypothetical protein
LGELRNKPRNKMKKRNKPENKMLIQGEHTSEYVRTLNLIRIMEFGNVWALDKNY